jgi:ubiquinone/menaquinone biosynthesis C-methylase UbiE
MKWIFERIKLPPGGWLLDIGCGPGDLWVENQGGTSKDSNIVMADFSDGMLNKARENLASSPVGFHYALSNVEDLPFATGTFDVAIANFMLYHVSSRDQALSQIRRVLRPGGRFYAATNGQNHMREVKEIIARLDPDACMEDAITGFALENGADYISRYFHDVTLHRREDSLLVNEVDPLVAYILSTQRSKLFEEEPNLLDSYIEAEISRDGPITISKDVGMFESSKYN